MQTVRMAEEWKAVKGYEGLYEVSNTGKVRSIDRVVVGKDGKAKKLKGKELFFTISKMDAKRRQPRASVQLWKEIFANHFAKRWKTKTRLHTQNCS